MLELGLEFACRVRVVFRVGIRVVVEIRAIKIFFFVVVIRVGVRF